MKERCRRGRVGLDWEEERRGFFWRKRNRNRGSREEEKRGQRMEELEKRDKERQKSEKWEKIGQARYNRLV